MKRPWQRWILAAAGLAITAATRSPMACGDPPATAPGPAAAWRALSDGDFSWTASLPLVGPAPSVGRASRPTDVGPEGRPTVGRASRPTGVGPEGRPTGVGKDASDRQISVKDPTVVFDRGRWHVFATARMESGKVDIQYLSFTDWSEADRAERHLLGLHDQYYCAPEVFYFRPHRKWYLIYQMADAAQKPSFGPAYSTSTKLDDPASWSKPRWLLSGWPEGRRWLDFWVISDAAKAHLFYTSLNGKMWHAATSLADFPRGWSEPELAIQGDIFEASHTYKLKGLDQYLTIVEAQGDGRRYYKAYLADRLEGPWRGLADRRDKPFASYANVKQDSEWTTSISHGELLRTGVDQTLEVDPADVRFLFQGASDREYRQKYGLIPWRLGILKMAP